MSNNTSPESPDISSGAPKLPGRRWAKFMLWARRLKLAGRIEILLSVLAVISAITTYIVMSRKSGPFELASGRTMRVLLAINLALLLALGVSIGRWFVRIWLSRKGMAAGSRLQTKVTSFFIAIAIVPPIIMTVFSALFLEFGIQSWFSDKVRSALNNSLEVAETYMIEHRATIEKDMQAIALAFNRLTPLQQTDNMTLQQVAYSALNTRLLSEVLLIEMQDLDTEGAVVARANQGLELTTSRLQKSMLDRVRQDGTFVASNTADNTVVGMTKLNGFLRPTYLYIARDLDPQVLGYLQATRSAVADYESLEGQRSNIQLQFNVVFIIVALLILLAAIWIGLWFSAKLVTPLSNLVDAAERVGQGDLGARVPSPPTSDEVGMLSRAFNRMTDQIARHQDALIEANQELDERRRFLEEVLEGVSAGVIGLQQDGTVFLPNRSAANLLGVAYEDLIGKRLHEIIPEFSELLRQGEESAAGEVKGQVLIDVKGETRTLLVRVFVERGHADTDTIGGYVITFDDLTEQLADQRTAAWADVARRIAHEIKNPLTPIQLSAERLKRKYLKEIASDTKVFSQCTDTIIRQVGDLRRMVDEFSSFARMPAPILKEADIADVLKQAVFLQDVAASRIQFTTRMPDLVQPLKCDGRLVGQALTNILKNAVESVTARIERDMESGADTVEPGLIKVDLIQDSDRTEIRVDDNGLGLPQDQKDRLMEPYVTTRAKGTGLGLAIVRRIMEEHGGIARIADRAPLGARAVLVFSHSALEKRALKADDAAVDEKNNRSGPAAAE
ncbi:sensor histidine kinase NtrY-like [Kordiimonas gwangyangensis]|uniref:sensor histidine kinase NtrY-like n=1 Tax=Kordiimonas gwangyangensis TaxID=288022 RepID=UPI0003676CBD|nr:PAS domain-containing sensor histidine kinase [Kordiimonas gwangyangensis]